MVGGGSIQSFTPPLQCRMRTQSPSGFSSPHHISRFHSSWKTEKSKSNIDDDLTCQLCKTSCSHQDHLIQTIFVISRNVVAPLQMHVRVSWNNGHLLCSLPLYSLSCTLYHSPHVHLVRASCLQKSPEKCVYHCVHLTLRDMVRFFQESLHGALIQKQHSAMECHTHLSFLQRLSIFPINILGTFTLTSHFFFVSFCFLRGEGDKFPASIRKRSSHSPQMAIFQTFDDFPDHPFLLQFIFTHFNRVENFHLGGLMNL